MEIDKVYGIIGMANRARRLVSGDETCERTIRLGKAKLCIAAENASENTKKKFTNMCNYRNVKLIFWGDKEMLGKFTGKAVRAVIVVTDNGFSKKIQELIGE